MAKRKSKPKGPYSLYWRKRADVVWSKIVRSVGECEICGATEHLNAHHLIGRNRLKYRHDPYNGICLCAGHHMYNADLVAHGSNQAVKNFFDWIEVNKPATWEWFLEHKDDRALGERIDYEAKYHELSETLIKF